MKKTATRIITPTGMLNVTITPDRESKKYYTSEWVYFYINWTPLGGDAEVIINFGRPGEADSSLILYGPDNVWVKYGSPGTYTINVSVTDMPTGDMGTASTTVEVSNDLTITSFTSDKQTGPIPLTVAFNRTVTGGFTPYQSETFDPGDGTGEKPAAFPYTHTYNSVGTFTAKYTVTDALGATSAGVRISLFESITQRWSTLTTVQKALCVVGVLGGIGLIWKYKGR